MLLRCWLHESFRSVSVHGAQWGWLDSKLKNKNLAIPKETGDTWPENLSYLAPVFFSQLH